MSKLMMLTVVALAFFVAVPKTARSGAYSVEPCLKSRLCAGLVEHFSFEEGSDSPRFGAFGSVLHEKEGVNIGTATGQNGVGLALSLDGSSTGFLWSSTFVPNMSSGWSMSFWFKATALPAEGQYAAFFSRHGGTTGTYGPTVGLYKTGGVTYVRAYVWNKDATVLSSVDFAAFGISTGTWYHVAAGVGEFDDTPGGQVLWVNVNNNATKNTAALSYFPTSGLSHFRVGQTPQNGKAGNGVESYNGLIDELDIYGRTLGVLDVSLLYNSGAHRTFPYDTE